MKKDCCVIFELVSVSVLSDYRMMDLTISYFLVYKKSITFHIVDGCIRKHEQTSMLKQQPANVSLYNVCKLFSLNTFNEKLKLWQNWIDLIDF